MHSKFLRFFKFNLRSELKLVPYFSVPHFQSCIFLPWKFGPSFSSRVGRSLMYLILHWSFIFRSCIFSLLDGPRVEIFLKIRII